MLKKYMILILAVIVLLGTSACSMRFSVDDSGNLTDTENDRYYIYCSDSIRAKSVRSDPYASSSDGYKYYEIVDMDPAYWLSEDITLGIPYVFREDDIPEPVFSDFSRDEIFLTQTEVITIQIAHISDPERIAEIRAAILESEPVSLPSTVSSRYSMDFCSDDYPGLYYSVLFIISDTGDFYFYDRGERRCVAGFDIMA